MESEFSALSSLSEQLNLEDSAPGVYKEAYRLALYALLNGGREAYQEFLKAEGITDFLSEEEVSYILENKKWPSGDEEPDPDELEGIENAPSTYCPMESDVEVPDLDLGWPEARLDHVETNIHMLFHPPRQNMPSIKTVVRKYIREAKMVIAIAMDIFTDVDIFRDLVEVSTRGVVVYILLDDLQFHSFLRMAEKASVPLQKLWNVRIRTVKGHEYRCQSGAKFHGAMEQKFMLVDCHTALYGSYSFMWSYEKINLSMMLLITGKLVACYDEEFRRLFARSNVPALLIQQMTPKTDHQVLSTKNQGLIHGLHPSSFFGRSQSFDAAQLKTIRGRLNMLNHNNIPEEGTHANGVTMNHALNLQRNHVTNTYAGFQHGLYSSLRQRSKVMGETGVDVLDRNPLSAQLNHQAQYRKPAQDDSSLYAQQPSFLSSSELSLHRWRIESYLKNDQVPADSTESLDCMSLRSESRSSLQTPHSSRPNLILKGLEQPVTNELRPMQSPLLGRRTITSVYTSLQRAKENGRDSKVELEHKLSAESNTSHAGQTQVTGLINPSTEIQHPPLRTTEHLPSLPETNYQSVPETKQDTEADNSKLISPTPSSVQSPIGSIITDTNGAVAEASKDEPHAAQKLTESHRSVSHHDIKTTDEKKTPQPYIWQEPPSRTVSASHIGTAIDSSMKASNLKRLRPFSDSNKTRLSLIEIPEEKESIDSIRNVEETSSSKDTDEQNLTTLTKTQPTPIEANVHISERQPSTPTGTITSPTPSCSSRDWASLITSPVASQPTSSTWGALKRAEGETNVAASPRTLSALDVVGDHHHRVDHGSMSSVATVQSVMSNPGEGRFGIPEVKRNKVYSRFEHFLSVERRTPDKTDSERTHSHTHTYTTEKRRSLFMGASNVYSRYQTQTQTDNKRFGKFIQRVGSFISKNK